MRPLAAFLACSLLLAGCVGGADDPVEPQAAGEAAPSPAPSPEPGVAPPPPGGPAPATPPASDAPPASGAPAPAPRIETARWNETITGAGASPPAGPACCLWRAANGNDDAEFQVPEGAKAIVLEVLWDDATVDLDVQLLGADYAEHLPPEPGAPTAISEGHAWSNTAGRPGEPDGHAILVVADAEALVAGTWAWRVGAEGPANEISYEVAASVFLDAAPPEGYSAVAPSDNP